MKAAAPEIELRVERFLGGIRIDSFLARHCRNYSQWRISRMVEHGAASINGRVASLSDRVQSLQVIVFRLLEPPDKLYRPESAVLSVVYEDPWMIVVDKAAGMIAHPVGGFQSGTLCHVLQGHFDLQTGAKGMLRPGLVHRLDRMTSGLMVVAKQHESHRFLAADFEHGRMRKCYVAMAEGQIAESQITVDRPIGFHPNGRSVLMSCGEDALKVRSARTDFHVLRRYCERTLVACELHTGRNHQIRVHLAAIGHPVVGDEFYRPFGAINPDRPTKSTLQRHALHASLLQLKHPIFGSRLTFRSAPPDDFWRCVWDADRHSDR